MRRGERFWYYDFDKGKPLWLRFVRAYADDHGDVYEIRGVEFDLENGEEFDCLPSLIAKTYEECLSLAKGHTTYRQLKAQEKLDEWKKKYEKVAEHQANPRPFPGLQAV